VNKTRKTSNTKPKRYRIDNRVGENKRVYTQQQKLDKAKKRRETRDSKIFMPQMSRDTFKELRDETGKYVLPMGDNKINNALEHRRESKSRQTRQSGPVITDVRRVRIPLTRLQTVREKRNGLPSERRTPPASSENTSTPQRTASSSNLHPTPHLREFHSRVNPEIKLTGKLQPPEIYQPAMCISLSLSPSPAPSPSL
jgi:hypothetical protein